MQDRGFNSFVSNVIKLSANETEWSSLLAGPALLFFTFRFEGVFSGPKSYRDFRETGPRLLLKYSSALGYIQFTSIWASHHKLLIILLKYLQNRLATLMLQVKFV